MSKLTEKLKQSLGISDKAAKLYFAALEDGPVTLTELERSSGLPHSVTAKPLQELLELGLFLREPKGKRFVYHPLSPHQLPSILEQKRQQVTELANQLTQQISVGEHNLQIRAFSGIMGIQDAFKEFFSKSHGDFIHFENAETYSFIGKDFAESLIKKRVDNKRKNKVIVVSNIPMDPWYKKQLEADKEQLRETIIVSANEYPYHANIAAAEDMVMVFEYREKPFALLIKNSAFAESVHAIHRMVWDRYKKV